MAIALSIVAACASSSPPVGGATTASPRTTGSASSTPVPPSPDPSTPRGSGSVSPRPSAPSTAQLGSSAGGRVTLARTCVHRGNANEPQTVTVTAGPGETVTYSTYYSDFSSELNRPDYTTGQGYGQAGPDGRFRASWTVPAGATPGRATVRVTATDMTEDAQEASYIVVKQGDRCP